VLSALPEPTNKREMPKHFIAWYYWNCYAPFSPAARKLAKLLYMDLPASSERGFVGLMPPIRRLVIAGQDTAENMNICFGRTWEADVKETWEKCRIGLLYSPPAGSPSYMQAFGYTKGLIFWYGPTWKKDFKKSGERFRIKCQLCTPEERSSHVHAEELDQGADIWRPRDATEEEEETLKKVREVSWFFEKGDHE